MNHKQWHLALLWLLLANNYWPISAQTEPNAEQLQAPRPRGRIRITDMQMARPAPPSIPGQGPISWPSYEPIGPSQLAVPMQPSSTVHTHIPLLREPQLEESPPVEAMPGEGRVQESVVYGNWKPEHPVMPLEDETQPKQRVYGRLEAMLMGLPAEPIDRSYTSSEELLAEQEQRTASSGYVNPYTQRGSFERSQESRGRWRTPTTPALVEPPFLPQIEVVRINATDPLLRQMAKQINESIETTTARKQQTQTLEDNWMPLPYPYPTHSQESTQPVTGVIPKVSSTQASTLAPAQQAESTTFALSWPTDFLEATSSSTDRTYTNPELSNERTYMNPELSNERTYTNPGLSIDRIDEDVLDDGEDYKYYEDSLNSAQLHNTLSVPDNLIPQLPLNITRVGIPYEARNSAEEPTICVPLTVTETASESATPLLVEIERIYCFPLPKVEIRQGNSRPVPTEPEHSTSASVTSVPTDQPQPPAETAGASRPMILALLVVMCSSILAHL